jgi:hypothetical protein
MAKKSVNRREKSSSDDDSVVEVDSSSYEESSDNESSSSSSTSSSTSSSSLSSKKYKEIKVNNLFAISNYVLSLFTSIYYFYIYRKKSLFGLTPSSRILLPLIMN